MPRYLCMRALSFRWRRRASARVYLHIYPPVVPIDVEKSEKNPGFTFPVPIDVSPYHQRLARGKQRSSNRGRFVLTVKNVEVQGFGELSQQVQAGMENMLKMITEIDQSSSGIKEEIEKCKYYAFERKRSLEEDKDEEVDKVLTSVAGETAAQLPEAVRKEKLKHAKELQKTFTLSLVDKWWGYYFQKLLIFFTTNEAPYLCLFLSRLEIYFKHQLDDKIFKGQFRHSASFGNCKKKQDLRALTGSFLVWCYLAAGVFHRSLLLLLVEMGPSEKEKDHVKQSFGCY
ncbi:hypothetical protein LXL04_034010 [Taraxacum kok-saghyz]